MGSVIGITDATGSVVARYAYDPWGRVTSATGTDPTLAARNPLRYRAYYLDAETGLYYMPARYYDPSTYRFLSADPASPSAGDPASLNAFAYCQDNPIMYADPSGAIIDCDGDGRIDPEDLAQNRANMSGDPADQAAADAATTAAGKGKSAEQVRAVAKATREVYILTGMTAQQVIDYYCGPFGDIENADLSTLVVPGSESYTDVNVSNIFPLGCIMVGDIPIPVGLGVTGGWIFNKTRYFDGHTERSIRHYAGVAGGVAGLGASRMRGSGHTDPGVYREFAGGVIAGGAAGKNLINGSTYGQGGLTLPGLSL